VTKDEQIETALKFLRGLGWSIRHNSRTEVYKLESPERVYIADWVELVGIADWQGCRWAA